MPTRRAARRDRLQTLGRGCTVIVASALAAVLLLVAAAVFRNLELSPAIESGPDEVVDIPQAAVVSWTDPQPRAGVDVSFPQCGRTLRDLPHGYVIVGLDGGMPDRPNRCFADQWAFALRQAGAAVYVNTADDGRGDPERVGRRNARDDIAALGDHDIQPGTPVWLDVELPEVWQGSQARHRAVIAEHLRVLAEAGYPVGVYSAPALWAQITGDARLEVPTWVGIGRASADRAAATCEDRSFGGRRPDIVQRIGAGSDGRPLDRNLTCPGVDLDGLIRPH